MDICIDKIKIETDENYLGIDGDDNRLGVGGGEGNPQDYVRDSIISCKE